MKIYNIYSKRKEYTMPAKASGKIKTSIIRQTQKNGDIYILERQTIYDSEKKYNKVLSTKLISKIPKGSEMNCTPCQGHFWFLVSIILDTHHFWYRIIGHLIFIAVLVLYHL